MGRDNSPPQRQRRKLERKQGNRASYDRVLIVSEGSKTEPLYFEEIRQAFRLHTANVHVLASASGTESIQVVNHAEYVFEHGDLSKRILPRAFESVYAVFDRDDHRTFFEALSHATKLDRKLKNDLGQPIHFKAIVSIPCFELWLLLHFEDVTREVARDEIYRRLKGHVHNYAKGKEGIFASTRPHIEQAMRRAKALGEIASPHQARLFSGVSELYEVLRSLRRN